MTETKYTEHDYYLKDLIDSLFEPNTSRSDILSSLKELYQTLCEPENIDSVFRACELIKDSDSIGFKKGQNVRFILRVEKNPPNLVGFYNIYMYVNMEIFCTVENYYRIEESFILTRKVYDFIHGLDVFITALKEELA
jgi:hypothetical protein